MIKYKYIGKVSRVLNINKDNNWTLEPGMVFDIPRRYEYIIKKRGAQAVLYEYEYKEVEVVEQIQNTEVLEKNIEVIVEEAFELNKTVEEIKTEEEQPSKEEILAEIVAEQKKVSKKKAIPTPKKKAGRPKKTK